MPDTTEEILTEALQERVDGLISEKLWGQLSTELQGLPPADVAVLLARHDVETIAEIFKVLPEDLRPDVLAELPTDLASELAETIPAPTAAGIVEEMDPDDAADVLGELDKDVSAKIIEGMDKEGAEDVRRLLSYPEESAGGIMTTDLLSFHPEQTVLEALDAIANNEDEEHVYQVYIVDADEKLLGAVSIWRLLRQRKRERRLGEIMDEDIVSVRSDTDQEDVADLLTKYDLSVIPVVDDQDHLLGRITHDDVADVIKDEAEEDIFQLAGSSDDELGNVSAWRSCWYRLPWLFVTLLGGVVTATITSAFNATFGLVIILAAFIPNVMGMGGNTGLQSSVLMIREIASGSSRRHSLSRLFLHELRTGALMGIICGFGIFLCALAILYVTPAGNAGIRSVASHTGLTHGAAPFAVAGTAGLALFCAMTFAAGFGAVVPIVLDRMKIDTAVASGPFISVMDDISALLIYYGVAWSLFAHLLPS